MKFPRAGWWLWHGAGSARPLATRNAVTRRERPWRPAWPQPSPTGRYFHIKPLAPTTTAAGRAAERRARLHYRVRGYRILAVNARAAGSELDIVLRRGSRLVFSEVKAKAGDEFGDPLEMIGPEKRRRLRRAAEAWLAAKPELAGLEIAFEVVAVRGRKLERLGTDL